MMSSYKTPAILALRRGDVSAIRSIIPVVLTIVSLMRGIAINGDVTQIGP
jgi:hypothetical protein